MIQTGRGQCKELEKGTRQLKGVGEAGKGASKDEGAGWGLRTELCCEKWDGRRDPFSSSF